MTSGRGARGSEARRQGSPDRGGREPDRTDRPSRCRRRLDRPAQPPPSTAGLDQLECLGASSWSRRAQAPKRACRRAETTQPRRDEAGASRRRSPPRMPAAPARIRTAAGQGAHLPAHGSSRGRGYSDWSGANGRGAECGSVGRHPVPVLAKVGAEPDEACGLVLEG
jgi:hypothetical protein